MQIKSSIHILYYLATRIKWISETELITFMNREYLDNIKYLNSFYAKMKYSTSVSGICQDYLSIYCCSFLDEYEKVLTPKQFPDEAEKIVRLKRIVLPAYRQLKKWKDLKKFRNNVIAHNHRINGISIFEHEQKIKYNIPATNEEFTLMADLVFIIAQNIHIVFPETTDSIDFNVSLRDHLNINSSKFNTFKVYKKIEKEIEKNKNSL